MQNTEGSHLLPSGGRYQEYLHRLANGGYECKVATGKRAKKQKRSQGICPPASTFHFLHSTL